MRSTPITLFRRWSIAGLILFCLGLGACASSESDGGSAPADTEDATSDAAEDTSTADSSADADTGGAADTMDGRADGGGDSCEPLSSPPDDQLCSIEPGNSGAIVLRGDILTESGVVERGSIRIEGPNPDGSPRTISCVGCDCGDRAPAQPTVLTCPDAAISPGLVNAHDHLGWSAAAPKDPGDTRYNHRHGWRVGANGNPEIDYARSDRSREGLLYGEVRMLLGGATTIAGSTSGDNDRGLLRNADNPASTGGLDISVEYSTFPLGDIGGELKTDGCDYGDGIDYGVLRRDIFLPHVAEGIGPPARNEYSCQSTYGDPSLDVMADNTSIVHGIGLTADDIRSFASQGGQLVWSPRTNVNLYGQTADVPTYRFFDVPVALGTDWAVSGSRNMLSELSCADDLSETYWNGRFTDRQLWRMATVGGAKALGLSDRLGRLEEGYVADVALFDASEREAYSAVVEGLDPDVELVLRGGTPLYGRSPLVDALVGRAGPPCSELDVCGESKRVCVRRDTAAESDEPVDFEDVEDIRSGSGIELFSCGSRSESAPVCRPSRPGTYDGRPSSSDADGDGIPDSEDSCPQIFNPERPIGDGGQPDADDDGRGDPCDPCPTSDEDDCSESDLDGDGTPNDADPCPYDDSVSSPGNSTPLCGDRRSITPYEIHDGSVSAGTEVELTGLIVTGTVGGDEPAGFFAQLPQDDPRFSGEEGAGIYVRLGPGSPPDRGALVDLVGLVDDARGRLQINGVPAGELHVRKLGQDLPDPVDLSDPCSLRATDSANAPLFGSLVKLTDARVTDGNPDAPDDFGEFALADCSGGEGLRVDDVMHSIQPRPGPGDTFDSLVGPLFYSFDNTKLVPRDENDVGEIAADVRELTPSKSFLKVGRQAVPKPGLEVELSRKVSKDTDVALTYGRPAALDGPSTVTVPSGSSSTSIQLDGKTAASNPTDFVSIDAKSPGASGSAPATAEVLVYDDSLQRRPDDVSLARPVVNPGANVQATVRLNMPAPSGDQSVSVSTGSGVSVASQPVVTADDFETTFDLEVDANAAVGTRTIETSVGSKSVSTSLRVKTGPVGDCLIISEYIEGSGSNNKAIELYNCGGTTLDLKSHGVCIAFNDNTTCSSSAQLDDVQLSPGEVHTVCKSKSGSSGDPVAGIQNNCDQEESGTMRFNGNDRLLIFEDGDGNGGYSPGPDEITDSFGRLGSPPSGTPWSETTYRRCDTTPYKGGSAFDVSSLYTSHPKDDASDYGSPPSRTSCP